jgi:hypothetical protein
MDSRPTQQIKNPREHLLAQTRAIVEGTEEPSKQNKITYLVSGGPPTRRIEHALEISGTGAVSVRHLDQLGAARVREVKSSLGRDRITQVFRLLLESRLLENVNTGGGFLPDSVIGAITVRDGMSAITYYFLADEQKRRFKGIELNPSVSRFTSVLEALSEEIMRRKEK